jgi:hypothetical protein
MMHSKSSLYFIYVSALLCSSLSSHFAHHQPHEVNVKGRNKTWVTNKIIWAGKKRFIASSATTVQIS